MGTLQIKKAVQTVFASKKAKIIAAFGVVVVVVAALVVGNGGSFRGYLDFYSDIREVAMDKAEPFLERSERHKAFNLRKFDVFNPIFLAEAENQGSLVDKAVDPVKVKDGKALDTSRQFISGFKVVIGSSKIFDSIDYANDLTVNQFDFARSGNLPKLKLVDFAKEFERNYIKNYEIDALPTSGGESNNGKTTLLTSVVEFPFLGANMLQFDGTFDDESKDINRPNVARNAFEVSKNKKVGVKLDQRFIDQRPMLPSLSYVSGNQCLARYRQPSLEGVESRYFQWVPFGTLPLDNQDFNHATGEFKFVANQDLTSSYNYLVYRLSRIPYQKVETCSYNGKQERIIESGFYYLVDQAGVVRIKTEAVELPEYDLNLLSSVSRVEAQYKLQVSTNRYNDGDKLIVKIDDGNSGIDDLTKVSTPNDYWLFEKELNLRSQNAKLDVYQESSTGDILAEETFYVRLLASDDPGGGSLQDLGNGGNGNGGGSGSNDSGSASNNTVLDLVVTSATTANATTYNLTGTAKNANKLYYRDQLHQISTKLPIDVFNISGRGQMFTKTITLPYLGENTLYLTVENSSGQAKSVTHSVIVNSGVTTPDRDGDRIIDDRDLCPSVPATNGRHADRNNDGVGDDCATPQPPSTPANPQNPDSDGDGVVNERDNCPTIPNPGQRNTDGAADGGDACDEDDDNNGFLDALEPPYSIPQNADTDGDGVVNVSDNCSAVYNLGQTNSDNDALGDACDEDDDNDTVLDALDNCPTVANTDQADSDRDLVGNVCEGLVAETVNPIDLTFVPATPNIFKVDTKAPSNRVVVNLYNATTDSPIYTVDFHLSEGTTATTPLAVGQYNCVLLLGCNGFNGQVQSFTLPLNVPLYYKASIKLADGFTYSDRSENFVFTTLPTAPGQGVGGQEFTDVNQFDPNYVAVKYVAELGLMRGSNGLFRPYDQLTRAESFAISNRLSGANRGCQAYNPQFDGNLGFVDLFASINAPETYWYMTEIKCSRALGIVRGYADGTVKPLNAVNEAESVKVLLSAAAAGRALRATLPLVQGLENPWWLPYYEFLNRNGLNFPVNNGGQIITRGQFAQLVYALGNRGLIDANTIRSNLGLSPLSPNGTAGVTGSGFNNSIVLPPAR